jgi:hypothetical protein
MTTLPNFSKPKSDGSRAVASRYPEASASGLSAEQKSGALAPGTCSSLGCRAATTPTFYRAHFTLTTTGDTFLDVRKLGKGALWINGHPIGRFWNIGPQQTLFVPAPWLHEGNNEIVIFDLTPSTDTPTLTGLASPILDGPVTEFSPTRTKE